MKPVRILVADDHDIVRKGLRAVLASRPGWQVCGEAANGREAVAAAIRHRPDIAIIDINMPELNGLEATREILKQVPEIRVLVLSAHDSESLVRQMLASGARGYVHKSDVSEDLIAAVETLCQGRVYFTSRVSDYVLGEARRGIMSGELPKDSRPRLSPREREVLQLLAEGKANKEVATAMGISVKTVETHRGNVMSKLGMHSLSDLVRYAIQNEIIRA